MAHPENHIRTYSGLFFDPFDISSENVRIEDIAHALSMMVRANGHLNRFFSIAQHCINCSKEAQHRGLCSKAQLACLLHDASECYLADIPRPVKHRLYGYAEAEERVTKSVFTAFGIADIEPEVLKAVSEIDDAMLYYEFNFLAGTKIFDKEPFISKRPDFSEKKTKDVEKEFLHLYNVLYNGT